MPYIPSPHSLHIYNKPIPPPTITPPTHTTSQQYPFVFPRSPKYHILISPLCPQYFWLQWALSSTYMWIARSTTCCHQFWAVQEKPAQPAVVLGCWESQAERLWVDSSPLVLQTFLSSTQPWIFSVSWRTWNIWNLMFFTKRGWSTPVSSKVIESKGGKTDIQIHRKLCCTSLISKVNQLSWM